MIALAHPIDEEGGWSAASARLRRIYELMYDHFGSRHWWPADTDFEVAIGAILTQSVSWRNVEQAVANLKQANLLDPHALYRSDEAHLASLIVSTRFYTAKAKKLKRFVAHLVETCGGSMEVLLSGSTPEVRRRLLAIHGIGPETADCILLYAGEHPVFVVDAYTRRIFHRMGFWDDRISYEEMQSFFEERLPRDVALFNEYHALIDGVGNRYCRAKNPLCEGCPLLEVCAHGREAARHT